MPTSPRGAPRTPHTTKFRQLRHPPNQATGSCSDRLEAQRGGPPSMMSASRLTQASRPWSRWFSLWGSGFVEGRAPHARDVGIPPYRGASPFWTPGSSRGRPGPRRGGLRTPAMAQRQLQRCLLLATWSSSTHVVEMKCLGVRTALQSGRGDRVPCMYNTLAVG